jgi:oxepin-CoA hydrolase/3-oxo-5,6-dehydrosuberyl-CoA semialdehyde dehydrogenase
MTAIERIKSYVFGEWRDGSGPGVTLENPATEAALASADTTGLDLRGALAFARSEGGAALRALGFDQRAELLAAMSAAIHAAREPLIDSAIANGGCTRGDAKFDIDGAIGTLSAYAEWGKKLGEGRVLADGEGLQLGRSPKFWAQHIWLPRTGCAVLINAFNFPAWGFAEKAACALLAGMPLVTKPATATAHTAYLLTEKLVGLLPRGALSFVGGPAGDLLDHLIIGDVVAFTGSADTAKKLRQRPAFLEHGIPLNVEADSLNAAVLGPDVEPGSDAIELFYRDVVKEMTQKTGQKCTATRRILVPAARVAEVEAELALRLGAIKVGDPSRAEVGMGPLATKSQLADVQAGIRRLLDDAVRVLGSDGRPGELVGVPEGKGHFFPITLLRARSSAEAAVVHTHEVFGPVATILPYSGSAAEGSELVRRGAGGLVASVYSDDRAFLEEMVLGIAPFHGRLYLGSGKVREHTMGPGTVLPSCVHGGPGHAGGGEELGGIRGVTRFMQRTAIQGYRPLVEAITNTRPTKPHGPQGSDAGPA